MIDDVLLITKSVFQNPSYEYDPLAFLQGSSVCYSSGTLTDYLQGFTDYSLKKRFSRIYLNN